jgi:hypothetical protein
MTKHGRRIVAVLMVATLVLAGVGYAQKSANGPQPLAELVEQSFDFGDVFEQEQYTHVFLIRNRGKAELVIEDVKPG